MKNDNLIEIIHSNSYYHHLLPGFLISLNIKSLNDLIENNENFSFFSNNNLSIVIHFLKKIKSYFPLFKSCFESLFNLEIKPPINSSNLNYNLNSIKLINKNLNKEIKIKNSILQKKLILPVIAVSYIIGKNGKSIELIRKQTNAIIKIHDLIDNNSQVISLIGFKSDIELLESLIQDKLIKWRKDFLFNSYR